MKAFSVVGGSLVPVLVNMDFHYTLSGNANNSTIHHDCTESYIVIFVSLESVYHYREQWKNYPLNRTITWQCEVSFPLASRTLSCAL